MFDRSTDLRDLLVVAGEEGALLGIVSGMQIDTEAKRVAAFTFRRRKRVGTEELFVPVGEVESVGRDVVTISREAAAIKKSDAALLGRSLKELQGAWVTALDGNHVGTLVDVEFTTTDWAITELILADDKKLPIDRDEVQIGDEILVPIEYRERVEDVGVEKRGFLHRVLGGEALDDMKQALRRALRRKTESEEKAGV
jgi:sporulation protein YlmC with PRC-barrel domain